MKTKELFEELCILGAKMTIPQDTNKLQVRKEEIEKELEASIRKEVVEEIHKVIDIYSNSKVFGMYPDLLKDLLKIK